MRIDSRVFKWAAERTALYDTEEKRTCRFCRHPIRGREFPLTLAGGNRIIGYICSECLRQCAREVKEAGTNAE